MIYYQDFFLTFLSGFYGTLPFSRMIRAGRYRETITTGIASLSFFDSRFEKVQDQDDHEDGKSDDDG